MRWTGILWMTTLLAAVPMIAAEAAPPETQIAAAVMAAPDERREGAAVLGYDGDGKLIELRQGSNDLICLADSPGRDGFEVDCYHKDLEPYMARGRELSAQGVSGKERNAIRWKEVESGKLKLPKEPRTLYVLTGKGYDAAAGTVIEPYLRWVIYTPFATPESTGLSTKAGPGVPWLMYPGTAGAHIMISPPRK